MKRVRITEYRLQKRILLLVTGYWLLVIGLTGCATITEGARGFIGVSTKILEDKRPEAITKTFSYDYDTCYSKTKKILGRIGTYIYAEDAKKKLIAVYVSETDTTPVGVFFKGIDEKNTQIEVSSPSPSSKELIAGKVFLALEKSLKPDQKEGQEDAEEKMGTK